MSSLVCALSGEPPREPVVCKATGRLFERSLIMKHLADSQTCPISNEPMTADDLVELKANPAVRPRTQSVNSVPVMLQTLQNEWDNMMLESFELKKNLDTARQQLSQSLYQYDAACRVIARITKERDDMRSALEQAQQRLKEGNFTNSQTGSNGMESDSAATGLPDAVKQTVSKTGAELLQGRKKRAVPEGTAEGESFASYKEASTIKCGRSALTAAGTNVSQPSAITVGANNGDVVFVNLEDGSHESKKAHKGAVSDIAVSSSISLSGGADGIVKLWKDNDCAHSFDSVSSSVAGVSVHPSESFAAVASQDGAASFVDLASGASLASYSAQPSSTLHFHPDGMLLGFGGADGVVRMWDVKAETVALSFNVGGANVDCLQFSENGYHIGTVSGGTAKVWDLRKLAKSGGSAPALRELSVASASSIAFDYTGQFIAVSGSDGKLCVVQNKTWADLASFQGHKKSLLAAGFGSRAASLYDVSSDCSIKVYSA